MPITWIPLTVAQLDTAKAAALVDALQTAALADGQADPLPEIIGNVVARIRMEIAAGGRTVLAADTTTIPPSLKSLGLRMVLREGQSRLNVGGALELSDQEKEEWRQDVRLLERIAKGEITVESSDAPEATPTVQSKTTTPLITARDRQWTRANQDGV
ncbi:hypothetical protein [Actomonas aquatica]|uniref:Flagellar hook-length control protein-like C-terminal domain-containing protein n=1 Tax=Actomonas aquatica TaxID=2866162 RepID=A0ABZ1CCX6_9BACT|nr:hypothetical protein [Opitutus sp. WL0086]WRQ89404.1 hypothetical protein K1X11_008280 [Opitutus sp. WL0086]